MKVLLVIDMQNDFIEGSLGSKEALGIVDKVCEKIQSWNGEIFYTMDTHFENYMDTNEGKHLPVVHCIKNTWGWQLNDKIKALALSNIIEKPTFGSVDLIKRLKNIDNLESIMLVGLCTDICVISNALLIKSYFPNLTIEVDASCTRGVSMESYHSAIDCMKLCHIDIINEE